MSKTQSLNMRIDADTNNKLKALSQFTGVNKSEIIRTLIRVAHDKHVKRTVDKS